VNQVIRIFPLYRILFLGLKACPAKCKLLPMSILVIPRPRIWGTRFHDNPHINTDGFDAFADERSEFTNFYVFRRFALRPASSLDDRRYSLRTGVRGTPYNNGGAMMPHLKSRLLNYWVRKLYYRNFGMHLGDKYPMQSSDKALMNR